MPPVTQPITSADPIQFLEKHGLVAHIPPARSSDDRLIRSNPFLYYLTRRLGLSDPFRWSKALSRGSWLHTRMEHLHIESPSELEVTRRAILGARAQELRTTAESFSIGSERLAGMIEREERDCLTSWSWIEAILDIPFPTLNGLSNGLRHFLNRYQTLGTEVRILYNHPLFKQMPLVAQLDRLALDPRTNTLWIMDYKSVDGTKIANVTSRLLTIPFEFQTLHYMTVAKALFDEGHFHRAYNLGSTVRFGGMAHITIAKPTIEFGLNDRDCEIVLHTLKSGPRKGQIEERRNYGDGAPRWPNYVKRCISWYEGSGEYLEKKDLRTTTEIPINVSFCHAHHIENDVISSQYLERLRNIHTYAVMSPHPDFFTKTEHGLVDEYSGKPTRFSNLFVRAFNEWPDELRNNPVIIAHRDEDLLNRDTVLENGLFPTS